MAFRKLMIGKWSRWYSKCRPCRTFVVASALTLLCSGCTKTPRQRSLAADTLINRFVALRLEQVKAKDPAAVEEVISCEGIRLNRLVGPESLIVLLDEAGRRVKEQVTAAQWRRVQDSLSQKVVPVGDRCEEFAAAGLLGGPLPQLPQ